MTWRDIYDAHRCPQKSTVEFLDALQELVPMRDQGLIHALEVHNWLNTGFDLGLVSKLEFTIVRDHLHFCKKVRK